MSRESHRSKAPPKLGESKVEVPEEVIWRELGGEAVIMDLRAGRYYGLDGVGLRMWQLLEETGSVRRTVTALSREFDADPARIRRDLEALVKRLERKGLLSILAEKKGRRIS